MRNMLHLTDFDSTCAPGDFAIFVESHRSSQVVRRTAIEGAVERYSLASMSFGFAYMRASSAFARVMRVSKSGSSSEGGLYDGVRPIAQELPHTRCGAWRRFSGCIDLVNSA
jgi:hypothetical protein